MILYVQTVLLVIQFVSCTVGILSVIKYTKSFTFTCNSYLLYITDYQFERIFSDDWNRNLSIAGHARIFYLLLDKYSHYPFCKLKKSELFLNLPYLFISMVPLKSLWIYQRIHFVQIL